MDQFRIAVLGDGGVGKTAIAVQTYDPTIEDAYRKQLLVDDRACYIEVIDTAGQEEYAALRDQWIRQGQGFILVYSVSSLSSFDRLAIFRESMIKVKKDLAPYFILVGNKADQDRERQVSFEKGRERAAEFGCDFMETSAKTAHNIDKLFVTVVRKLREQYGNSTVTELPSHFAGTRMAGAGKPYKKPGKPGRGCVIV